MRRSPLAIDPRSLRRDAMVGTGGIGWGEFFALHGDHTLGREESRGGRFEDRRDYCKLHIVSHYFKVLVGPRLAVYPIGKVGDDESGRRLLREMRDTGLDLSYTGFAAGERTLRSLCLSYPDGSGGNLTADDSASAHVAPEDIRRALALFSRYRGRGIALALPEVPLEARAALLVLGREHGFLTAASFLSGEMDEVRGRGLLDLVDLLAMNTEEAAHFARATADDPLRAVAAFAEGAARSYPGLTASITAGRHGSWVLAGGRTAFLPAFRVEVRSAAGAGDAHMAGILAGLAAGLDLFEAHEIGRLAAAVSVTSPHTIHPQLDRAALLELSRAISLPPRVAEILRDDRR